jgi:hypothetical protein
MTAKKHEWTLYVVVRGEGYGVRFLQTDKKGRAADGEWCAYPRAATIFETMSEAQVHANGKSGARVMPASVTVRA